MGWHRSLSFIIFDAASVGQLLLRWYFSPIGVRYTDSGYNSFFCNIFFVADVILVISLFIIISQKHPVLPIRNTRIHANNVSILCFGSGDSPPVLSRQWSTDRLLLL